MFYTACDGTSASDTVKVKKVEEDGSGAATVADTTLAGCGAYSAALRWPTGLAIHDGYAYFSWQSSAGTGIGRVPLTGGSATVSYILGPMGTSSMALNSTPAAGHFYVYVDDGRDGSNVPVAARIARVPLGGGAFSTVRGAGAGLPWLSFGMAGDSLFFAENAIPTNTITLLRSSLDGSGETAAYLNFAAGAHMGVGGSASLVAGTADRIFVYSLDAGQNGYSTVQPVTLGGTFGAYGAVPKSSSMVGGQVWSGSHLYFAQADAVTGSNVALGRVAGDGSGLNRNWVPATSLHQIAIGAMPTSASTGTGGGTGTPSTAPAAKTSLNGVINTKAVKKITTWPVSVPCSTTTKVVLRSCKVQVLVKNPVIARLMAKAPKATVVGGATKKAASGATRVTVKVPITNRAVRDALRAGKTVRATIRMTVTAADGSTGTASKATTLVSKSWRAARK